MQFFYWRLRPRHYASHTLFLETKQDQRQLAQTSADQHELTLFQKIRDGNKGRGVRVLRKKRLPVHFEWLWFVNARWRYR